MTLWVAWPLPQPSSIYRALNHQSAQKRGYRTKSVSYNPIRMRPETQLVSGLISKKRLVVLRALLGFYQPAEVVDAHEPFPLRGRIGFKQR